MSLRIDKLHLRLPPGYSPQAESITRAVIQALAHLEPKRSASFGSLQLAPIQAAPGTSTQQVAEAIVRQLTAKLEGVL